MSSGPPVDHSLAATADPQAAGPAALSPAMVARLSRHGLLAPLVEREVVAEAVQAVGLPDEVRRQAQQGWSSHHGISSREQLEAYLQRQGLSEADLIWQAELPARVAITSEQQFGARAENRFLARKNALDEVIYSLLRVSDAALARELYLRIAEGEADFAQLAARYAEGPEKATRGVVGPVPLLQAHPHLAELLRTSRPGQLRPPLQIEQWWLVVRLENLRPAAFDDAMRQRMARELFDEWVSEEVARRLAALQPQ
ncbi:MAG: peptidylprolyl isomerase [Prochlorococcaceae cyanobacterium]